MKRFLTALSLLLFFSVGFAQCSTLFKSSVSIVYTVGAGVLLTSASVSASIDSLSRSLSQSSLSLVPKEEGSEEYGIDPKDRSTETNPKPREKWTDMEVRFVKDSILISKEYLLTDSVSDREEWNRDLQRIGNKSGHLVSDYYGLSLVAVGFSLKSLGVSESQFREILGELTATNLYGRNSLVYGFHLTTL